VSALKVARIALVVSLAIWAASLLAMSLVEGKALEFAMLIGMYSFIPIALSAVACLILGLISPRKAQ
jgi:hypothetical protein